MPKTKKAKSSSKSSTKAHKAHQPKAETHAETSHAHSHTSSKKKVKMEFMGSDLLKKNAPQAYELAEAVAEEWVNDGNFQKLPLKHPMAQLVATIGLQSAKKVEKKLEERGVFMMAKAGLEYAKSKMPMGGSKSAQQ
jgi:hypothetical protein